DETAGPNLTGHAAFHARVASNALATVLRDLELRPANEAAEIARLKNLLDASEGDDLAALNARLSEKIQSGDLTLETPGLLEHLKTTTVAQVEIDQPRYSGLRTAKS
ncbi:MAG: hypothetical protein K0U61_07300, partial [Alphaproteobacteria bacterium]|nr:hypothetical protein [Alphaproteobacteria bacterium]